MIEGIRVTPAQVEALKALADQFGMGRLHGFQKGELPGPLLFSPKSEDEDFFIGSSGMTSRIPK